MILLLAGLAVVTSAACGSDNKVGDESLLNFKEQAGNRLGETTTTTAAATTTTATGGVTAATKPKAGAGAAATATTGKTRTAAPPPTATTAPAAVQTIREIYIYGDDAALPLDPQVQTAYTGSIIRWINEDTVPRAVRADSGQFASPTIKPGGSWDYTAGTVGTFSYGDDTRPYVKGEFESGEETVTGRRLRMRCLGAVLAAAVALAGCARSDASPVKPTPGQAVKALEVPNLPADLLGLKLAPEDVTEERGQGPGGVHRRPVAVLAAPRRPRDGHPPGQPVQRRAPT